MTNNVRFLSVYVACCSILYCSSVSLAREWTDVTGNHQFEAKLVQVTPDLSVATMIATDGKRYEIPLSALSDSDRDFAIAFAKQAEQKRRKEAKRTAEKKGSKKASKTAGKTWTNVPEDVLFEMRQEALRRFPNDKGKQFSFINSSVDEYLGVQEPKSEQADSATKSKLDKDGNSEKKKATEQTQKGVPTAVVEMLNRQANVKWPKNKRKRIEFVKKQLGYYYVLQEFEMPELPELVIIQLKHNATKVAPNDFKAQLRYVYDQVQVAKEYLTQQATE